jgi:hypothetical protein
MLAYINHCYLANVEPNPAIIPAEATVVRKAAPEKG